MSKLKDRFYRICKASDDFEASKQRILKLQIICSKGFAVIKLLIQASEYSKLSKFLIFYQVEKNLNKFHLLSLKPGKLF